MKTYWPVALFWGLSSCGQPPEALIGGPDSFTTTEDTPLVLSAADLLNNDSGPGALSVAAVTGALNGSVTLQGEEITFLPASDFRGVARFLYSIENEAGEEARGIEVTVSVNAAPDGAPVASDDTFTTQEDLPLAIPVIGLLANDTDPNEDPLTITALSNVVNGSAVLSGSTIFFTPSPNFNGAASFLYTVSDGAASDSGLVSLTIEPANDAPTALAQSVSLSEDTTLAITLTANDLEGDPLSFQVLSGPSHGTLSGTAPNLLYTPELHFFGEDSFTFLTSDGALESSAASVSLVVAPVNDAPIALEDSALTEEDIALTLSAAFLLSNDTDIDGDALQLQSVGGAVNGSVSLVGADALFVPDVGFQGEARFTYTVSDGALSATGEALISIGPALCGNGLVQLATEECDDGDTISGDGCSAACVVEFCGDGVINNAGAELCDDNNTDDGDGCDSDCTPTSCGNGILAGDGACYPGIVFRVGANPIASVSGDFNQDGNADLVVANTGSNSVSVLLGDGAGAFAPKADFPVFASPRSMTRGDFNQDGILDLVTANGNVSSVSVLLGRSDGTFSPPAFFSTGASTNPRSVAVGDFNQDGRDDLATANLGDPGSVSVLFGNGAGFFGIPTSLSTIGFPSFVTTADLDDDGRFDLILGDAFSGEIGVFFGSGPASFAPEVRITTGVFPDSIVVGDFNNDGVKDLALADSNSAGGDVLFGQGARAFSGPAFLDVGNSPAKGLLLKDLNQDGLDDLLFGNGGGVGFHLGTGAGFVGARSRAGAGSNLSSVAVEDFNNDGFADIAATDANTASVRLFFGTGTGSFPLQTTFETGLTPLRIEQGDFNEDGFEDVVIANSRDDLNVLFGDASGGFGSRLPLVVGGLISDVAVGDFNNDGHQDLAAPIGGQSVVGVLLGDGVGSFGAPIFSSVGDVPLGIEVGDFNQDNFLDLAISGFSTAAGLPGSVSILLGTGAGTFGAPVKFAMGSFSIDVAVGDLNGDGFEDVLTADNSSQSASLRLGDGAGSFGALVSFAVGFFPQRVVISDLNGDGNNDFATSNNGSNTVSVFFGLGAGVFTSQSTFPTENGPIGLRAADVNGDGVLDLVTSNPNAGSVSVLLGNGASSFHPQVSFLCGLGCNSLVAGDYDNDGAFDLVVTNTSQNTISVLLFQP